MWFLRPDHRQLQTLLPCSPHGESVPPKTRLGAQPMNYGIGNSEGIAVKASGSTTGQALHICIASLWWFYLSLWAGVSSGSSAGVSWGLRRGNFKVISAVWLSIRYFPLQALPLLPLHPLPSSSSISCQSPPQSFFSNMAIPNLCWSVWSTQAPVHERKKAHAFSSIFSFPVYLSPWHLGTKQMKWHL